MLTSSTDDHCYCGSDRCYNEIAPVTPWGVPEKDSAALDVAVETNIVTYVLVIGWGVPLPSNSIQPFSEQLVPFEQQPSPTNAAHSKLAAGQRGSNDGDAWHSDWEFVELQQNVPDVE
jgi:hypothetical protein